MLFLEAASRYLFNTMILSYNDIVKSPAAGTPAGVGVGSAAKWAGGKQHEED